MIERATRRRSRLTPGASDRSRDALARRASAPCITSSFQAECVVLTHMLREVRAGHPGAVPRHVPSLPADARRTATRLTRAVGAEPDQPAGEGAERRAVAAREHRRRAAQRHKVEPLFAALEGYDTWFTALRRDQSRVAREPEGEWSRSSCRAARPSARRADRRLDRARRVGVREGRTTSRCCRSTNWATRASAASRARRCRSIRTTRARAAGRARSSSAESTFRPSRSSTANSQANSQLPTLNDWELVIGSWIGNWEFARASASA